MNSNRIKTIYLAKRLNDPTFEFSRHDKYIIEKAYKNSYNKYVSDHSMLLKGHAPKTLFDSKLVSDDIAVKLWNTIFTHEFAVDYIGDVKEAGNEYIKWLDKLRPGGFGATEAENIRYVTASSSSSFLGVQNPSKSSFALNSMHKTLESHTNPEIIHKPWLIENLKFVSKHLSDMPHIMDRDYGDICMNAKMSSASTRGHNYYRDYVFENTYDDMLNHMRNDLLFFIFAGSRSDRRGKYRLICSFEAAFRIADYLINNGSYELCEGEGLLSNFTTEGYNNKRMWPELVKMSRRGNYSMVCIDYKGYDTQIGLDEYLAISEMLNDYRLDDEEFKPLFDRYKVWMTQPKPLVTRNIDSYEVLISNYRTLASGLHGTPPLRHRIVLRRVRRHLRRQLSAARHQRLQEESARCGPVRHVRLPLQDAQGQLAGAAGRRHQFDGLQKAHLNWAANDALQLKMSYHRELNVFL
jgi:hypothetical protein